MDIYKLKNKFINSLLIFSLLIMVAVPVATFGDATAADETDVQDSESAEESESSENSGETDAAGMAQTLANPLAAMNSFQGGIRYWIKSTNCGPEGLGLRFAVTLLFPK